MKKKLVVVSRSKAERQFNNNPQVERMKLDNGKYDPAGMYIGKEVEVPENILAVYPVRQKDAHGPYVRLWCYIRRAA
ncbi:DUF987 family protein [Geoalkalibacter halelectricus]|uniref:DUF987 family protein n=1 Tax=Geoalkalibacter halelectricus TaxID=2847045 RepID=UPI002670756D|nr:DUF987 family protein [Geoalkalibacter halelectricus]MDO3380423.1 DUF987 domain-containing protein [Geoalkalibacter halelectricus]